MAVSSIQINNDDAKQSLRNPTEVLIEVNDEEAESSEKELKLNQKAILKMTLMKLRVVMNKFKIFH